MSSAALPVDDGAVRRLRRLDTCAVSDALDQLELQGVILGLRSLTVPRPFAGRAITVELGPNSKDQPVLRHLGTAAIEMAQPGNVIVVGHNGDVSVAGWGGLLSLAASRRGVAGVIVDGAIRDVDQACEAAFPVIARAAVPITARGRVVERSTNEPVVVGGSRVAPGDLVLVDGSGVVVIGADVADQVIACAERIAEREAVMAADLQNGRPITEVMGVGYEAMLTREEPA